MLQIQGLTPTGELPAKQYRVQIELRGIWKRIERQTIQLDKIGVGLRAALARDLARKAERRRLLKEEHNTNISEDADADPETSPNYTPGIEKDVQRVIE